MTADMGRKLEGKEDAFYEHREECQFVSNSKYASKGTVAKVKDLIGLK